MKRLFLLLALLGMVATGCSKDEVDKGNDNKTEQPNEDEGGNIPDDAYISLNKDIVTISPDGESVDVKVYSNYAWELTNNCDWVTTSIASGDASDTGVIVTLTADLTYDDREGTIVFSCGKAKKLLVVSQKFKEAIIPDANNTFNIPAEGGVAILNYQTNIDCEVIIPDDAQGWITIAPASRGLVSESITLDIAENTTYSARTAVIKVVAKDNTELAIEYTINQEQNDAILANGNTEFTISGREQQITIEHKANIDCDVIIPEEAQDWVTITPATRGLSTYSTTLNIAENNSGKERSCVIQVTSQGDNELSAEYTITQNPRCFLYYTSRNGTIVQPYSSSAFGATILSNTYIDGVGVIEFYAPISTIGDDAFYNCWGLTSVTIPDSVTEIGYEAFALCSNLQEFKSKFASEDGRCLIIDGTLNAFAPAGLTEYAIPYSVTTIGGYAFYGCSSLTSVTIPNSITTIGERAFYECSGLTSVNIGDSVTTIGNSAFRDCYSLTSVTIGDSVTTIGNSAFRDCYSLTSVTIGNSVTEIGSYAFYSCDSLTSVTIPNSVTTIGSSAFYGCTGELIINSKIIETDYTYNNYPSYYGWLSGAKFTKLTIGDSVTTIGSYAFYGCSSLTSVTIPNSITTIGERAFYECNSLTSVYISDIAAWCNISFSSWESNPLYYDRNLYLNNELVTDLIIPDSVTSIGDYAFKNCDSLKSVTIPDSVTKIGDSAFGICSSLTSVTIPDSVITIGEGAFEYCRSLTSVYISDIAAWCNISFGNSDSNPLFYAGNLYLNNKLVTDLVIPNDITEIKSSTFSGFNSLTSVTIGNNVTTIGYYAFYWCESLTSVTIPDSVTTIGRGAFANCSSLTNVTIPDSVTSIGEYAFYCCSSLTSITIPDSVTTIGEYAFYCCKSLTSATIGDSVTTIGDYTFSYCSSLTSVTIPDSVTTIGDEAFYKCSSLTSVTIPDSVTSIGKWAFRDCSRLTSVTIGDSVTKIGKEAFYCCSSLTSVTIGDSVTEIGDSAFEYCESLTSVYCKPTTPPVALFDDDYWWAFINNASGRKIYVPMESVEAYKSASGWSKYAGAIVGYDF